MEGHLILKKTNNEYSYFLTNGVVYMRSKTRLYW